MTWAPNPGHSTSHPHRGAGRAVPVRARARGRVLLWASRALLRVAMPLRLARAARLPLELLAWQPRVLQSSSCCSCSSGAAATSRSPRTCARCCSWPARTTRTTCCAERGRVRRVRGAWRSCGLFSAAAASSQERCKKVGWSFLSTRARDGPEKGRDNEMGQ